MNMLTRRTLASFVLLALASLTYAAHAPKPVEQLTPAQWRADLDFMTDEMKRRHPNLYHSVSREQFETAIANMRARIPALERNEIVVAMMRIAASIGDGHTRIDPRKDPSFGFPSLPLKLYLFEDGLYVRAAQPEYASLVGSRIEAIGGVPVSEAIERVAEIASRDNEIGPRLFVPIYLAMPDILHALGLSSSRKSAVLTLRNSQRTWIKEVPALGIEPLWPPDTDVSLVTPDGWIDARTTAKPPLWLQAPLDYHRLIELPEHHALYVQLNMVTNIEGQTLTDFGRNVSGRVRSMNPRTLVLDLRLNQGGNGELRSALVRELIKSEDADTRLFVPTWRGTFSASQFILDDLDRLTDAIFIGEPASSKPSSYSDAYRATLPNSGIAIRTSILWWQAGQNKDPWTWVDVATTYNFADYQAGKDPALEAALTYTPEPPLAAQVLQAAANGGLDAVRHTVDVYRANPTKRYADQEMDLIRSAGRLSSAQRHDEAIFVAELVTRQFPASVDAFRVLAQLAERAHHPDLARTAARRALEIDPNDRLARALLEKLDR